MEIDHDFCPSSPNENSSSLICSTGGGTGSSATGTKNRSIFSQRIFHADSYTSIPIPELDVQYSTFRGTEIKRVPVIRIFGSSSKGQKTCTHIHGVFPYFYILQESGSGMDNLQSLANKIDQEINSGLLNGRAENVQHVYKILAVTGRSFYGYKSQDQTFLKILFFSPMALTRASELFHAGRITGSPTLPYESHVPFILQFFMDFQLYGMNFINYTNIKFRGKGTIELSRNPYTLSQMSRGNIVWDLRKLPFHIFLPEHIEKKSRCDLEIDVMASDIVVSRSSSGKNPGIEAIWMDERERRKQHGILDWEHIEIPESQSRPPMGHFVFKRELELAEKLRKNLAPFIEDTVMEPLGSPNSRIFDSQSLVCPITPSSQLIFDDVSSVNSHSQSLLSQNQGDSIYGASLMETEEEGEMNDEEVLSLLQGLAEQKQQDEIEPDSIINLGDIEEFTEQDVTEADLSVSFSPLPEIQSPESDKCESNIWSQESISEDMFEMINQLEAKCLANTNNSGTCSNQDDFKLDQCDGQFDSDSDSDQNSVKIVKEVKTKTKIKSGNWRRHKSNTLERYIVRSPIGSPVSKTSSTTLTSSPKTSITRSPLSKSSTPAPSPRKFLSPLKVRICKSPEIDSGSSSDDSMAKTLRTQSSRESLLSAPIITPELSRNHSSPKPGSSRSASNLLPRRNSSNSSLTRKTRICISPEILDDDSDEGSIKEIQSDVSQQSRKRGNDTELESDVHKLPRTSMEIKESQPETLDSDLGENSQSLLTDSELTGQGLEISPINHVSQNLTDHDQQQQDLGMESIYLFDDEEMNIEDENSDEKYVDSQNSLGVMSFYEYDSSGSSDSDTEINQTRFLNVVNSMPSTEDGNKESTSNTDTEKTSGNHTPTASSESYEDEETEDDEDETGLADMTKIKELMKSRKQFQDETREREYPSVFSCEIKPLKELPEMETLKNETQEPEPLSISYFRQKSIDPYKGKFSSERKKMIQDIVDLKRKLLFQPKRTIQFEPRSFVDIEPQLPGPSSKNHTVLPTIFTHPQTSALVTKIDKKTVEFIDEDSESEDELPIGIKSYKFGGGVGDSGSEDEENSDRETQDTDNCSNPPTPATPYNLSQLKHTVNTPVLKSSLSSGQRRLTFDSNDSDSIKSSQDSTSSGPKDLLGKFLPQVRLNDSELDSMSFYTNSASQPKSDELLNSSNYQDVKALHECQFLTTISLEIHSKVREDFLPDPRCDTIEALFFNIYNDSDMQSHSNFGIQGCYLIKTGEQDESIPEDLEFTVVEQFENELALIQSFILLIQSVDADILVGYEITRGSWGYLIDRGISLGVDMTGELSRLIPLPTFNRNGGPSPQMEWNESINGRVVLNLWKLLRHEITVTSYSFENAAFHILHERVHKLSFQLLSKYWNGSPANKFKVYEYYKTRAQYTIRLISKLDLINRTSELARLFGIQFFEVLSRGSQFRVESMMLRLAKPANLIPPSPSPAQRGRMKAPEYLPLIMEPESKFYTDPVAVLDFQSLYPSMMMAYNYCFSTCIGRVQYLGVDECFELGCLMQELSNQELAFLFKQNLIHISPCGVAFVKSEVKKGILGDMLMQILDTRQMVKRAMKKWKGEETLQKVLDSRQLGLKLIANVTYGYTSANFSGRMPCIEIADSVVSKGRETLQRAIDYVIENQSIFGAKVVYGDTDSLFVHFPNKTREEAFRLSEKLVQDITDMNPKPVKLKLEKIYQPCILQTKKRYVGFAYETFDQKEPKYDAKGIETVRRDGCPAVAKILEGTLKALFITKNETVVRNYVQEQFRKIFIGRVSLNKYFYARAFRGRQGYRPNAIVPALQIAKKLSEKDPRAEPLTKERVPYVIVYENPNTPLYQLVRRPQEFMKNPNLRLNAHYYIEKAILPALNRCLALANLDVEKWYKEMPHKYLKSHYNENETKKGTIDQYFQSESCIKCESRTANGFCKSCFPSIRSLEEYLKGEESIIIGKYTSCCKICQECSKETEMTCINIDCPVKHRYLRYVRDYNTKLPVVQKLRDRINMLSIDW